MRKTINLKSGKKITFPCQMFRGVHLEAMGITYVEDSIYLNKRKLGHQFPKIEEEVKKGMAVISYTDVSTMQFSEQVLLRDCKEQEDSDSDFIILPYFKNETAYDVRRKLEIAGELKMITDKKIILEISYRSLVDSIELSESQENFDILSIFYGVHYGHLTQFNKIINRITEIKVLTSKPIFCMAVPTKFAGGSIHQSHYMPCWELICESWTRNWKLGRNGSEIKITDSKDLRHKSYNGWLSTGHLPHEVIPIVNRTVYELFHSVPKKIRDEYHLLLADEILSEVRRLTPYTIQEYVLDRFHQSFVGGVFAAYRERIVSDLFRTNPLFSQFAEEQRKLLEYRIRDMRSPSKVYKTIEFFKECIETEKILSVPNLIARLDEEGI